MKHVLTGKNNQDAEEALSENITKEKAEKMGIKAFLLKPLLKAEMAQTIRRVLEESRGIPEPINAT